MKNIAVLGSTGSIGSNVLEIASRFPKEFSVAALSTNSNIGILYQQIKLFSPGLVCVRDPKAAAALSQRLKPRKVKLFVGEPGLKELVRQRQIDQVVLAISGSSALLPLLAAIESRKDIALANKEALVMAGPVVRDKLKQNKISLRPIDSEQSAIWQCLDGRDKNNLKYIYLTASGGPFLETAKKDLKNISIRRVLKHPRWKMGKKVSVDSATLMNKGLELLETIYLFDIPPQKIKILIHPEAIIHSMVEFQDGVVLAQLSATDMRIPIQYALSYPERLPTHISSIDFSRLKQLNFRQPDYKKFPCLQLAYQAAYAGGTLPCVLNAANELSVEEFLAGRLKFLAIAGVIKRVMERHKKINQPSLAQIQQADAWARKQAMLVIKRFYA